MGEGAKGCAARRKVAMIEDLRKEHRRLSNIVDLMIATFITLQTTKS